MSKIAPSVLAADFLNLEEDLIKVQTAGADLLHIDVMDGCFVPPISFGQEIVKKIKAVSKVPLDVHLMVNNPEKYLASFADIGIEYFTFHIEATSHAHRLVQEIKSRGIKAGIAINPGTDARLLEPLLHEIDLVLVMTVNPGWGGQKFIPTMLEKIEWIKDQGDKSASIEIEVDGGINESTAKKCKDAGASIFVAGTYIFSDSDYARQINSLR